MPSSSWTSRPNKSPAGRGRWSGGAVLSTSHRGIRDGDEAAPDPTVHQTQRLRRKVSSGRCTTPGGRPIRDLVTARPVRVVAMRARWLMWSVVLLRSRQMRTSAGWSAVSSSRCPARSASAAAGGLPADSAWARAVARAGQAGSARIAVRGRGWWRQDGRRAPWWPAGWGCVSARWASDGSGGLLVGGLEVDEGLVGPLRPAAGGRAVRASGQGDQRRSTAVESSAAATASPSLSEQGAEQFLAGLPQGVGALVFGADGGAVRAVERDALRRAVRPGCGAVRWRRCCGAVRRTPLPAPVPRRPSCSWPLRLLARRRLCRWCAARSRPVARRARSPLVLAAGARLVVTSLRWAVRRSRSRSRDRSGARVEPL